MAYTPEERREYHRRYMQDPARRAKRYAANERWRQSMIAWIRGIKEESGCIRCGFANPRALQFHHRDPSQKTLEIANCLRQGWGKDRLQSEIDKCDVLCANCHAIEHSDT